MTPDSFSDGAELLEKNSFEQRVSSWKKIQPAFLDLGGESTAPMNIAIGEQEEWRRLEQVLSWLPSDIPLSLDSYRPQTVARVLKSHPLALWNDISGQLDDPLAQLLALNPKLQSVFCHNRAPAREHSSQHLQYISREDIWSQLYQCFEHALKWYKERHLRPPKLDVCFGFSKNFEQNWQLLRQLPRFIADFEVRHGPQEWILGVSRKSFFKQLGDESVDQDIRRQTEYMQTFYLAWLWQNLAPNSNILVRLHDPALVHAVKQIGERL